jgi:hypothetical protein
MWGNLADRLGATDINSALEKIGNAVAPRESGEDEEFYDDDDDDDGEYEDSDDYDYDDDDDDTGGIASKVAATPFRLAGMLAARALGDNNRRSPVENADYTESNDDDDDLGIKLFTQKLLKKDEEYMAATLSLSNHSSRYENWDDDEEIVYHNKTTTDKDRTSFTQDILQKAYDKTNIIGGEIIQKGDHFGGKIPNPPNDDWGDDDYKVTESPMTTVIRQKTSQISKVNPSANNDKEATPTTDSNLVMLDDDVSAATNKNIGNKDQIKSLRSRTDKKNDDELKQSIHSSSSIPEKEKYQTSSPVSEKYLTTKVDYNDAVKKIKDKRWMAETALLVPVFADKKLPQTTSVIENVKGEINDMVQTTPTPVVVVAEKLPQTTSGTENDKGETNDSTEQINQLNVSRKDKSNIRKSKTERAKATKIDKEQVGSSFAGTSIGIEEESSKFSSSLDNTEKKNHDGQETLLPTTEIKQTPPEPEPPVLGRYGSQDTIEKKIAVNVIAVDKSDTCKPIDETTKQKLLDAEFNCKELQIKLELANQEMEALRSQAQRDKEKAEIEKDELITQFTSKEFRLLQATSEENQNQTLLLEQEFSSRIQNLEQSLVKERQETQDEQAEYKKLLRESYANVDRTENQLKATLGKYENEIAQAKQQEERVLRKADDRVAQTMAILDERDEEISCLKKSIRSIEYKAKEHKEGEEEADEELEELHEENDSLRLVIENLKLETKKVRDELSALKSESEGLSGLRMELTMLKEENNREKSKNNSLVDSAMSSRTQIESERDTALSEFRDAKQQLAAALGDLEISRADNTRIMTANNNLQSALEAFQDERQAEMGMIDEQRREAEEGVKSAHATATSALKQIHEAEMYEIQKAGDKAVKNLMHEMELLENDMEKLKSEKNQMRRSLDEAIHRLQSTQEDVIDRNMMKNILVDWCTLNDQKKREQILQLMANLLHFSEDEREKVHLTSTSHRNSVGSRVVGALSAPLPPSKADVEHLEGSNVHEKWVNFLMAETDDG